MSSRFSSRSLSRATLSSWTTSAAISRAPALRAAIRAAKAKLFFLPAYSPDLNPIEQAFAKMKTLLRKADARTTDRPGEPSARCSTASRPNAPTPFRNAGYAQP